MKFSTRFMTLLIIPLFGFIFSTQVYAQNIRTSNLQWEADQVTDKQTNKTSAFSCVFKTTPNSVEWIQKKGELKVQYSIISTEGEWDDLNARGTITYVIERKGKRSKIIFMRSASGLFISLDFSQPSAQTFVQQFRIKSVESI
jgi:hypothetical protein